MISTRRSYVYDEETGLYYLQSRYYNPDWGRFLNADALVATGQGMLGNNMFAYCGNNPVNKADPTGCLYTTAGHRVTKVSFEAATKERVREYTLSDYICSIAPPINLQDEIAASDKAVRNAVIQAGDAVGGFFTTLWDAYVHSIELQAQMQYQQDMAVRDFVTDRFSTPEKASNTMEGIGIAMEGAGVYVGATYGTIPGAIVAGIGVVFTAIAWGIDVWNEE